jgi:hypothetical protein
MKIRDRKHKKQTKLNWSLETLPPIVTKLRGAIAGTALVGDEIVGFHLTQPPGVLTCNAYSVQLTVQAEIEPDICVASPCVRHLRAAIAIGSRHPVTHHSEFCGCEMSTSISNLEPGGH